MNYLDCSFKTIHQALVEKRVTPLELAKEAILRAKADTNNAFEMIDEEGAIAFASTLLEPEVDNILWGIPYVAKDNFSTKGLPTTASSNVLNGYRPVYDATVIRKLREAKMVMIAKSSMDELAMGGTGTTSHIGTTYNPYDPTHARMIGGSSSGSAAAVAASIVPFALGSDTGDSVRKPAAYAGLVGLKPTWGRISRFGLFPFAPSLDHVGFFTRSVEDSAYILKLLSGRDINDSTSSTREVEDYVSYLDKGVKGARVAVLKNVTKSASPKVQAAFEKCLDYLKEGGAEIDYVEFGDDLLKAIYPTYLVISCAEATSNDANLDGIKFGPYYGGNTYQEVMSNSRTKGFSELIKRRFIIGSYSLMAENQYELFLRSQKARKLIVDRTNQILADHDFILAPSSPTIAKRFDEKHVSDLGFTIADNFLALGNFAGIPSINIPMGFEDQMPLGLSINTAIFEEGKLLSMARYLERKLGYEGLSALNAKEVM